MHLLSKEPENGLVGFSARLQSRFWLGSHQNVQVGRTFYFQVHMTISRMQFFTGCQLEATLSSLSMSLTVEELTTRQLALLKPIKERVYEQNRYCSLCNVIMEVIHHHLCSILLVRSKLLGQPRLKVYGSHRWVSTRRQGSPMPSLESAYHSVLSCLLFSPLHHKFVALFQRHVFLFVCLFCCYFVLET